MKLTFLGTGTSQGIPVIACTCAVCTSTDTRNQRLRTSALLQSENTTLIFDTGPDFRQQMLRAKVSRMDAVVLTHPHRDHVAGLDDIRSFYFRQGKPMPVYASDFTLGQVRREFGYFFAEQRYPGVPEITPVEVETEPFTVGDLELMPVAVQHYQMPVLGFRCGDLAYITDAHFIPPSEKAKLRNLKVLVVNALQHEPHISHFNLAQALELVAEVKPQRAWFTHISHKMGLHEQVSQELPAGVELAWDGLQIEI